MHLEYKYLQRFLWWRFGLLPAQMTFHGGLYVVLEANLRSAATLETQIMRCFSQSFKVSVTDT